MKTLIIQGSSRSDGNTGRIAEMLNEEINCPLMDLKNKTIGPYDYEYNNQDDDFLPLIREVVQYDLIIFITPVYWYTMSGLMKTFFDRISDCIRVEKELGRKLRGKSMAAVACGSGPEEVDCFFMPFKKSADYLGMNYLGDLHTWVENNNPPESVQKSIKNFADELVHSRVN